MDSYTAIIGAVIIAVFAALPGILTGYASVKSANNAASIAQKGVKVSEDTLAQTQEIHVAVNSNLSALKQELADSNKRVEELKNIIMGLTEKLSSSAKDSIAMRLDKLEGKKS